MTTTHAGIVAVTMVIVWGIIMLMLLRWAQANAVMQAARKRAEQQEAAERARAAAYWASPEGRQRRAQMDADQRHWEWQQANATTPSRPWSVAEMDAFWRHAEPARPTYTTAPVYIAPPARDRYRPVEQPARPRPVVQPAPVAAPEEQPIAVPDWPVPVQYR